MRSAALGTPRTASRIRGSGHEHLGLTRGAFLRASSIWPIQDILSLVCVCARITHPFITPARPHYPHYCNTSVGAIYDPPPDPPCICYTPYNISKDNMVYRLNLHGLAQRGRWSPPRRHIYIPTSLRVEYLCTYSWDAATRI